MIKIILATSTLLLISNVALFAGANAGIEQEVHSGEKVQLNGQESTLDRDGRFVRFNWKQVDGYINVSLSKRRTSKSNFIAPEVDEATVLTFKLITKEKFKNERNRKRIRRTKDFVDVIVLPKEEVVAPAPIEPTPTPVQPQPIDFDGNEIITHEGFDYQSLFSTVTGKVWLDRNLGATDVCVNGLLTESCDGSHYQWGRESDGHQFRETRVILHNEHAETLNGNGNIFFDLFDGDWLIGDSNGEIRKKVWSKTDGSSICPVDYRVPTIIELKNEFSENNVNTSIAFPRKAIYWSVTPNIFSSKPFSIAKEIQTDFGLDRRNDYSVRCIKD